MIKWCNCDVDADCFCRGGNPRAIVNVKMDPRLRGDDDIGAVVPTLSHFRHSRESDGTRRIVIP